MQYKQINATFPVLYESTYFLVLKKSQEVDKKRKSHKKTLLHTL